MADLKEIAEIFAGPVKKSEPKAEPDNTKPNEAREDLIAAFADAENKELSAVQRMEAFKLFIKLSGMDEDPFA